MDSRRFRRNRDAAIRHFTRRHHRSQIRFPLALPEKPHKIRFSVTRRAIRAPSVHRSLQARRPPAASSRAESFSIARRFSRCASGLTCAYVRKSVSIECPIIEATRAGSTPAARSSLAAWCRRSCKRVVESFALRARRWNAFVAAIGASDYQLQILAATGDRGVDVILEMLANVNLGNDLKLLAQCGRVIVIGSRGDVQITPRDIMSREAMVMGMTLWLPPPAGGGENHPGPKKRLPQ